MPHTVKTVPHFDREMKRLSKKYVFLKNEYKELIEELEKNPELGTHLGNDIYKIRIGVASKGKGKRGGARVITFLKTEYETVYLLSIYDKGEKDTISDNEIREIIEDEIIDTDLPT
jgi:mRNA-degrading endonuclease RelE of RelBE toxin-antitoxin system